MLFLKKLNSFFVINIKGVIDIYEKKLDIKEVKRLSFELPKENSIRTLIKYQ